MMIAAVCPLCGITVSLPEPLPGSIVCEGCGGSLRAEMHGRSAILHRVDVLDAVERAVAEADSEQDPVLKYKALKALEAAHSESLSVAYALLLHGRLHERSAKRLDFTVIKCFLLNPYEQPKDFTDDQKRAFYDELFRGADLKRCLSLTAAPERLMERYLTDLCVSYITLFLKGSSRYAGGIFGFSLKQAPEKNLALPTAAMIACIRADHWMTDDEKALLEACLYRAFAQTLGNTIYLDAQLNEQRGRKKGGSQ